MKLTSTELAERVSFLRNGPWAALGGKAWDEIALPKTNLAVARSDKPVKLKELFHDTKRRRQRRLKKLLKGHWERRIRSDEVKIRDSFDEALSRYQLYELAIETEYIPISAVYAEAREELLRLLWSSGARRYIRIYDYVAVAFLARRLNLDIGFSCEAPAVRKGDQSQFATFLSQHQGWYQDPVLEGWVEFLDDYQLLDTRRADKDVFWDFLKSEKFKFRDEDMLWQFAAGAERFVVFLSELYLALSESERPYYGSFYAYWMARFYGYDSTGKGFKRDKKQTNWSKALLRSCRLKKYLRRSLELNTDPASHRSKTNSLDAFNRYWELLEQRNSMCKDFWKETRDFLNSHIKYQQA